MSEVETRKRALAEGGSRPLEVAGPTRTLRVWRASLRGFVAIAGLIMSFVTLGIGGGTLLDTGPAPAPFVFLGVGVACLGLALRGRATGKEELELGFDPPSESLVLRRGARRHVLPGLSGFSGAWLYQEAVGTAAGAGDATLHVNWIYLERRDGGRVALPERFQPGDSRRIVAALEALLREHEADDS